MLLWTPTLSLLYLPPCIETVHYTVINKGYCPPSDSTRIKSLATTVADLQHTLKGRKFRAKIRMRSSVLQENRPDEPLESQKYAGEIFYEPGFSHLALLRKALRSSPEIHNPCDQQRPSTEMYVYACIALPKSHIY